MLEVFKRDERIGAVGGEILTLKVDSDNLVETFCQAFGFNRVSWRYGNLKEGYYPALSDMAPTQVCGHRAYFFVTANVAYRKQTIDDNERRFWQLPTGEDIDFGIRARKKGCKFYFLPQASVEHMHRADLRALLKVWKSYGAAHPPLLKAHAADRMEIIFQFIGKYPQHPILRIPFFVKGFIYIGNFHLMHIFGFLFLLFFILQWGYPFSFWLKLFAWITLAVTAYVKFKFFRSSFNIEPYDKWFEFAKMKYLTNLYFILGGLKGSFKNGTFCIEPSF
jgi:GT2 family glycosyltransferase